MQRRGNPWPIFLVVIFFCILILFLSLSGKLKFLSSFLEKGTSGIQAVTFGFFQNLPFLSEDSKLKELEQEKLNLLSQVANFAKIKSENAALSDQFQTSYPKSAQLLKADVVGAPSFVPGISIPNIFIIDKGSKDNLRSGMAVIIKNNLIGKITQVSENISQVILVNNSSFSFTAKTQNGALGVLRGGSDMVLDNVVLSEEIKKGELVLTKGSIDNNGIGVPPDLVVGKIISVEKNPSDLFQKAKVESFVNFTGLSTIFIYTQAK